jgi:hypothetical protein
MQEITREEEATLLNTLDELGWDVTRVELEEHGTTPRGPGVGDAEKIISCIEVEISAEKEPARQK